MKKLILSLLVLSAAAFSLSAQNKESSRPSEPDKTTELPARSSDWQAGPGPEWEIHYDAALAKAKAEHKKVYVLSTGSDWCGWCIKLRNNVLTKPKFKAFAKKNLVLLYLDSPSRKKLSAEQQRHNTMVRSMLQFGGGVPSAKVLDETGRVLAERSGYADLDAYMEFLKQAVRTASPKK